ncbi:MAG TPA: hypothetical protein VIH57_15805 [Bacteroidales bacterium]|jgi:hypothetical protein
MKDELLVVEASENKEQERINTDELIPDYSFMYKIRQLNLLLDVDNNNYGFCLDS